MSQLKVVGVKLVGCLAFEEMKYEETANLQCYICSTQKSIGECEEGMGEVLKEE